MEFPNWFDGQRYNFEDNLLHLKGKPNLQFLQIGAYTGDASIWLLENILTDTTSGLMDVDTWKGSNESEHKHISFDDVRGEYLRRINKYDNIVSIKSKSEHVLPNLNNTFDFIYIDGDHTAKVVSSDAEGAWKLLKSGGILAFDDYLWGPDLKPEDTPKPAIDKFLKEHEGEYVQLVDSYQVWIRKL
jgi:predicted O-methyltransferase YrrM